VSGQAVGSSTVTVQKGTPSLTTQVSQATMALGGSVTDTATLTPPAGSAVPTGTVGFNAYGPNDATCAGPPVFTSLNRPLAGGVATSTVYTPNQVGTYRFVATYSGDPNYNSTSGVCNAPNESVTVTVPLPDVPADFDGNGTTDISVFRPGSSATWYIRGQAGAFWGGAGDIAVPADYDGNGTTDIAVYRPGASAAWYIRGGTSQFYGTTGDIPVPGDYDGNGTTDLAVYRPGASAAWFILGQPGAFFGTTGDIPVPGKYDANATTDIAVYRPGVNSAWYISGQTGAFFGTTGDIPLPLPYAIRSAFFP
jgi:hypothetical protein